MKKSPIIRAVIFTSIIFAPLVTLAATGAVTVQDARNGISATSDLIELFTTTVVKSLGTLALSVALLAFFYGIIEYIWAKRQGDTGGVKTGGDFMKWGLIALFVMFSVYGIIKLGQSILFQGKDVTKIEIPSFNFGPNSNNDNNDNNNNNNINVNSYRCSPGYDCTLPNGGGIGLCNALGVCVSNSTNNSECSGKSEGSSCSNGQGVCSAQTCLIGTGGSQNNTVSECIGKSNGTSCSNGQGACSNETCLTSSAPLP